MLRFGVWAWGSSACHGQNVALARDASAHDTVELHAAKPSLPRPSALLGILYSNTVHLAVWVCHRVMPPGP